MKTRMKDSSLDAFFDLKKTPTITTQINKILSKMKPDQVYTRRMLANLTKIEISTISARVNEMLEVYIVVTGTTKDHSTNRTVEALQLKVA